MTRGARKLEWRTACARGVLIGCVVAVHVAAFIVLTRPPRRRPPHTPRARSAPAFMQVALLTPPLRVSRRQPTAPAARARLHHPAPPQAARVRPAAPAPAAPISATRVPAYVAGGGFAARLHAAQTARATPALPGGHHYLASDLAFVPIGERSIEGRVHKIAGLLFGGFDPTCKNLAYELAKPRAQQIADGYTHADLVRALQAHHCS